MARRVRGEGSVILTQIPYTNWCKHSRLHWYNFMAVSWSFMAVLSFLCCGVCGAETEFSILEEAQVLAVQMKKLSSQELGVFNMQRIFNSFVYTEKNSNRETEVQQVSHSGCSFLCICVCDCLCRSKCTQQSEGKRTY
uniref:Uncharacterized protein n=1 Tax=Hucho hucho TaxID=62062 RepID=A0A4W5RSB2_9TELE